MQNKGKKIFSIFIIMLIIVVLILAIYIAYYYISNYMALKEAEEAVDVFENQLQVVEIDEPIIDANVIIQQPDTPSTTNSSRKTSYSGTTSYRGYNMVGTIQIPKTKVKAPIVDRVTTNSISAAVGVLYGSGLNEIGNTVLVAHNYRNGTFFSNNKKLAVGDVIYVTDISGRKIQYSIYNTYITVDSDFSYDTRETRGKREISLSTCTTDATKRLVIWAREI